MDFPARFICATREYSTLEKGVPAPCLRRRFTLEALPEGALLRICGLGFYEVYINGRHITKGYLAPYISNPDDIIYYDDYEIAPYLTTGENVIGLILGNGLQNNPGGFVWDFEKAKWRSAPKVALSLSFFPEEGGNPILESDSAFLTAPSPILMDDYRNGEIYDARREIPGWNMPGFDDSAWAPALEAERPRGEPRLCEADPIGLAKTFGPVSVTLQEEGVLYDFGVNTAGLCRLSITGKAGQEITLYYGEKLLDGKLSRGNLFCAGENDFTQKDVYILKGQGQEVYTPRFTYHGFQYVLVKGMTKAQATKEALTYLEFHSRLAERGGFSCSDETVNQLQAMTRRSTLSTFFYFPNDCPQREKNGWTADAALSAEHLLLNLEGERSYREWMRNIVKAQREDGALPGIVPTGGWGFHWGNGPAWDSVLIYLPYYVYLYRGDRAIVEESAHAIFRYLEYLTRVIRPDGLIAIGLGDWCPVGRGAGEYKSPLEFTDTAVSMDLCRKAAYLFGEVGMDLQREFALSLEKRLYQAARERLIDTATMTALGNCQTSQSMAIHYGLFTPAEAPEALRVLLTQVEAADNHMDVGVLGARVLFHVLAEAGHTDLALEMITKRTFPAYGWWVELGATSLWELFTENQDTIHVGSLNHHFWGGISHFFIRHLAGIYYKPFLREGEADIRPKFPDALTHAEGFHRAPEGEISVSWKREASGEIALSLSIPETLSGHIRLPEGYVFDDGVAVKPAVTGGYLIRERL